MRHVVLLVFYTHVRFRGAPNTNHSNIVKFKMAVVAISRVSIFKIRVSLVFCACQNLRKRSGITPVQRKRSRRASKLSPSTGVGTPERVGRGTVFQFSMYSIQLAVDR